MNLSIPPTDWVVYILHADKPLGRARHYIGITRTNRLRQRMREHASGRGSAITRAMLMQGSTLYVARVIPIDDPYQERALKISGHHERKCPICQNTPLDDIARRLRPLRGRRPPLPPPPTHHWRT